jgi:hypothetical protein
VLPRLGTDLFIDSLTFHFLADNTQILRVWIQQPEWSQSTRHAKTHEELIPLSVWTHLRARDELIFIHTIQ